MIQPMLFSLILLVTSCVEGTAVRRGLASSKSTGLAGAANGSTTNSGAIGGGSSTTTDSTLISQRVELSHLVDPFDGTYKKKLTIPKNFKGYLYLAGLNISALSNKFVKVRFNFGVDKQSVILDTTVARAPGIIPKTDIQVLVIDMSNKPFSKMRLGYDLYDYTDYTTDPSKEIVSNPRDNALYCRGLKLEDDPTFIPTTQSSSCSAYTDRCLYSYAKIVDSTLFDNRVVAGSTDKYSSIPTRPQVWSEAAGVRSPLVTSLAGSVCLPDENSVVGLNELFDSTAPDIGYDLSTLVNGYYYRGPYRSIDDSNWQVNSDAIFNTNGFGLFQTRDYRTSLITDLHSLNTGFRSLMFPRAGKLSLPLGVRYMGSTDHFGSRTKSYSTSAGVSNYVDGCNIRALNYDPYTNEGISSCNVNSSIEIFYIQDGKEVSIAVDKSIKLQLIRPSLTNFEGKEVLTTAFKQCENSNSCGADECCFNSRCWSKDLVTQCVDQTPVIGNQAIGATCASDFECSTLCCNQSTGSCAPHNPNGSGQIFCGKSAGQSCVSKEFCAQEPVISCNIVKSGFKLDGSVACALKCSPVMTYGDCKAGTCVPPTQPAVPNFDPNDCTKAVDP